LGITEIEAEIDRLDQVIQEEKKRLRARENSWELMQRLEDLVNWCECTDADGSVFIGDSCKRANDLLSKIQEGRYATAPVKPSQT
jgi:hypothetical protein